MQQRPDMDPLVRAVMRYTGAQAGESPFATSGSSTRQGRRWWSASRCRRSAGMLVSDFDWRLADCARRMVRLLDKSKAIAMRYPAIMREICYWLLTGPHGGEVARMTLPSSHARRLVNAIHVLRRRLAEPVRIDELAATAQLSPSAFYRQFKALTAMTPMQYRKQLRLLEARRLMVSSPLEVETAAAQVGYESPSQLRREYLRMFGTPPRRDVASLKSAAA